MPFTTFKTMINLEKPQRLDKVLAYLGYGTRSEVKKMLKYGDVMLNDEVVTDPGTKVSEEDTLVIDENEIILSQNNFSHYILLNKPVGYISSTIDEKYPSVNNLIGEVYAEKLFSIGRLDVDTTGLIILTNDGLLAHRLTHPRWKVPKIYTAKLNEIPDPKKLAKLDNGVTLDDGYKTLPVLVNAVDDEYVTITLIEGKFHIVKRIFAAIGYEVVELHRDSMAGLELDELGEGEYRELTSEEIDFLKKQVEL